MEMKKTEPYSQLNNPLIDKATKTQKSVQTYLRGRIRKETLEKRLKDANVTLNNLIRAEKIAREHGYKNRFATTIAVYYFNIVYKKNYPWALRWKELKLLLDDEFKGLGIESRLKDSPMSKYGSWSYFTEGILGSHFSPKGRGRGRKPITVNYYQYDKPVAESEVDSVLRVMLEAKEIYSNKIERYKTLYKHRKPFTLQTLRTRKLYLLSKRCILLEPAKIAQSTHYKLNSIGRKAINLLMDKNVQRKWRKFKNLKTKDSQQIWQPLFRKA